MNHEEPGEYTPDELEKLKRIEEELAHARSTEFPGLDTEDQDSKLRDIEERARAARQVHAKHTAEGSSGSFSGPESSRSLGRGLGIAYVIIGVPLFGFGIGWLIDRMAGGVFWQGALTVLGAGFAVYYAVRSNNEPG